MFLLISPTVGPRVAPPSVCTPICWAPRGSFSRYTQGLLFQKVVNTAGQGPRLLFSCYPYGPITSLCTQGRSINIFWPTEKTHEAFFKKKIPQHFRKRVATKLNFMGSLWDLPRFELLQSMKKSVALNKMKEVNHKYTPFSKISSF